MSEPVTVHGQPTPEQVAAIAAALSTRRVAPTTSRPQRERSPWQEPQLRPAYWPDDRHSAT